MHNAKKSMQFMNEMFTYIISFRKCCKTSTFDMLCRILFLFVALFKRKSIYLTTSNYPENKR